MDKTIILVDYDNVFVTLKNNYRDFKLPNVMYDIITKIRDKYKNDKILSLKLFADFQKAQISDIGYDILKKSHVEIEHVFNGKNASDVILMINCMKYMMQYPHIDKIVLVSSDSDLVPIFHEVELLGKKLEVIYFDINTSKEHIQHIKEIGIDNYTIESILGINKYVECKDIDEFYDYKTSDHESFGLFLNKVNEGIEQMYKKYLKKDNNGNITNAGAVDIPNLTYYLRENCVVPERELWKNGNDNYNNIVSLLLDKNILIQHVYEANNKKFTTFILSEAYLNSKSIHVDGLITANDYPIA